MEQENEWKQGFRVVMTKLRGRNPEVFRKVLYDLNDNPENFNVSELYEKLINPELNNVKEKIRKNFNEDELKILVQFVQDEFIT